LATGSIDQSLVHFEDAGGVLDNVTIRAVGTGASQCRGIYFYPQATAEAAVTLKVLNCNIYVEGSSGSGTSEAIYAFVGLSSFTGTVQVIGTIVEQVGTTVGGEETAVHVSGANGVITAERCSFKGAVYDVKQSVGASLTLKASLLVNDTTSGTITYGGTLASETLSENGTSLASKYLGITDTATDSDAVGGTAAADMATDAELDARTLTNSFTWCDNSQSSVTNPGPRLNETNTLRRITYWCSGGSAIVNLYSGHWTNTEPTAILSDLSVTTSRQETNLSLGIDKDWIVSYWPTNAAWTNLYIDIMMERQD